MISGLSFTPGRYSLACGCSSSVCNTHAVFGIHRLKPMFRAVFEQFQPYLSAVRLCRHTIRLRSGSDGPPEPYGRNGSCINTLRREGKLKQTSRARAPRSSEHKRKGSMKLIVSSNTAQSVVMIRGLKQRASRKYYAEGSQVCPSSKTTNNPEKNGMDKICRKIKREKKNLWTRETMTRPQRPLPPTPPNKK